MKIYLYQDYWELFHRCDLEEAEYYLDKRAEQGFNVVQAVALAEIDGLNTPNPMGETPLINNDPTQPNPAYFDHVDDIINMAAQKGIYIALLPTWGDKVFTHSWGKGPEVFDPEIPFPRERFQSQVKWPFFPLLQEVKDTIGYLYWMPNRSLNTAIRQ